MCAILQLQGDQRRGASRALHSSSSSGILVSSPSSQGRQEVAQPQQNGSPKAVTTKNGKASNDHPKAVRKQSSEPMLLEASPEAVARSNTEQTGSPRVLTSHARTKRKMSAPSVSAKRSPPPANEQTPPTSNRISPTSAQLPSEGSKEGRGSIGTRNSYSEAVIYRSPLSSTLSVEYPESLVSAMEAVNMSLEEPKGVVCGVCIGCNVCLLLVCLSQLLTCVYLHVACLFTCFLTWCSPYLHVVYLMTQSC